MLGAGHPTIVPFWTRSFPMPTRLTSHKVLNPDGVVAWRSDGPTGGRCLWEMHNVWGWDSSKQAGVVLRENYFNKHPVTGGNVRYLIYLTSSFADDCSVSDRLVHGFLLPLLAQVGQQGEPFNS